MAKSMRFDLPGPPRPKPQVTRWRIVLAVLIPLAFTYSVFKSENMQRRLLGLLSYSASLSWGLCAPLGTSKASFNYPASDSVDLVNVFIGSAGPEPNLSGGMIPSVAPPFGMTRWTAQTTDNYVSATPYNYSKSTIHGFIGTHQPAIWMGESGPAVISPGVGKVKAVFEERGMSFSHEKETGTPSYYSVEMESEEGTIKVQQSATSRVGHLRFTYDSTSTPYVLLQASRSYRLHGWDPNQLVYPLGSVSVDLASKEITGLSRERQDNILGPSKAPNFAGYFVARFDTLGAFARFPEGTTVVNARVGVSFISVDQARKNLDSEIPDGQNLEETAYQTRKAWKDKLDRVKVEGGTKNNQTVFYTAAFHALQYPYEQSEGGRYYSGYTDSVHEGTSYTGYSIWDTYRAAWAWQILLAPERTNGMINSMLQDYQQGGWLPMWKNIVETNIMVGTHADSLIAEALVKGFRGFNTTVAYEALIKDATVPPVNDTTISYSDRQEGVGYEVRAGLSSVYADKGWVANDVHSEAGSRTLDYAYDDHAVAVAASILGHSEDSAFFEARSHRAVSSIYDNSTGFMRARNSNGSWAGEADGWTEGDKWAYTFDVVQSVDQLVALKGGNASLVKFLDAHFDGGHNDHTNEPSHHIPYLYTLAGAASSAQIKVREIANSNYNATPFGISGNEDCGQMSAWYMFSALGFYPVDPVSGKYVIGAPLFDRITVDLPDAKEPLVVEAIGAADGGKPFVKSVTMNGKLLETPILGHKDVVSGGKVVFEMSAQREGWGDATVG